MHTIQHGQPLHFLHSAPNPVRTWVAVGGEVLEVRVNAFGKALGRIQVPVQYRQCMQYIRQAGTVVRAHLSVGFTGRAGGRRGSARPSLRPSTLLCLSQQRSSPVLSAPPDCVVHNVLLELVARGSGVEVVDEQRHVTHLFTCPMT